MVIWSDEIKSTNVNSSYYYCDLFFPTGRHVLTERPRKPIKNIYIFLN